MGIARIKLVSVRAKDADSIVAQIKSIALALGVKCKGPIPLPTRRLSHTTRKTPANTGCHTFEKWELRIHKRLIQIDGSEQALRQVMRIPVPDTVQIEISLS